MFSIRMISLVLLASAGGWLWLTGEWRPMVQKVPVLAEALGVAVPAAEGAAASALPSTTNPPPREMPTTVRTWRDENGVVHFADRGEIPEDASAHQFGKPATLADYEQALQEETGVTAKDLYLAQQARLKKEAADAQLASLGGSAPANTPATAGSPANVASQQAYELMHQQQADLERIRQLNNRLPCQPSATVTCPPK